ncbi:hypothetical protein ACS3SW_19180 [Roseobacteraceae bacterium S113]
MSDKTHKELSDPELDDLFAAARVQETQSLPDDITPSPALLAAILNDAEALQPTRAAAPAPRSVWAEMREALGGWAGLGGLVAASVTGLGIGLVSPAAVSDVTTLLSGSDTLVEAYSAYDILLFEEG